MTRKAISKQNQIPAGSILKIEESGYDYIDSFAGSIRFTNQVPDISNILELFLTCGPKFTNSLLALRDKIVGVFGLKTSESIRKAGATALSQSPEPGESVGLFKLYEKTDCELVMGDIDKHLNFKVSLLLEKSDSSDVAAIYITTVVKFNNFFGRLYFFPVKPFHKIIVRQTLLNMLRKLETADSKQ